MIDIREWPATAGVVFGFFVIAMMAIADGDLSREIELGGRSVYIGETTMAQTRRGAIHRAQATVTITDVVAAVTPHAILLERSKLPLATSDRQPWIPKSLIVQCDTEVDEIIRGEEITLELPLWLVEQKGIVE